MDLPRYAGSGSHQAAPWGHGGRASLGVSVNQFISQTPNASEAAMSQVRVHNFSISLDGFGTGEGLDVRRPVRPRRPSSARVGVSPPGSGARSSGSSQVARPVSTTRSPNA